MSGAVQQAIKTMQAKGVAPKPGQSSEEYSDEKYIKIDLLGKVFFQMERRHKHKSKRK